MSACTLLVPGYVNHEEVEQIAKYISEINKEIPYSLLVFHPDYQMNDLPITPRKQAIKCFEIAKKLKSLYLTKYFSNGLSKKDFIERIFDTLDKDLMLSSKTSFYPYYIKLRKNRILL